MLGETRCRARSSDIPNSRATSRSAASETSSSVSLSHYRRYIGYSLTCARVSVKIETESAYSPERLFEESVKVFRQKVSTIRQAAAALEAEHHPHMVEQRKLPQEQRESTRRTKRGKRGGARRNKGANAAEVAEEDDPMDES